MDVTGKECSEFQKFINIRRIQRLVFEHILLPIGRRVFEQLAAITILNDRVSIEDNQLIIVIACYIRLGNCIASPKRLCEAFLPKPSTPSITLQISAVRLILLLRFPAVRKHCSFAYRSLRNQIILNTALCFLPQT